MSYKITIEQIAEVKETVNQSQVVERRPLTKKEADDAFMVNEMTMKDIYGQVPVEVTRKQTIMIYSAQVESLNVAAVIKAVHGL